MKPNTLTERLRGIVRVPVNDGAGLLDGKDFFERTFPTSNLAREAADEIDRLQKALSTTIAGHSHSFDEDISKGVEGGGTTMRCACGAWLWTPAVAPHHGASHDAG